MKKIAIVFVLCLFAQLISAQTRVITGTVTDAKDGSTLPGVSVKVKGTDQGAVTGMDGKYEVKAPAAATHLIFSFIGMEEKEVKIGKSNVMNVKLSTSSEELDEVVVVAYGAQKKGSVAGAVSVVGEKELENIQTGDVTQALQGKAAGVDVVANSGAPGSAAKVVIRGIGSINAGSSPLYVLDGIPLGASMNAINPNDIASISVLKDASAVALYGARAANGVVLLTSKKGEKGKLTVTYKGTYGFSDALFANYDMMNTEELLRYQKNILKAGPGFSATEAEYAELSKTNVNWKDEILQRGFKQRHDLSFNGGNDKSKYYISFNKYNEDGVVKHYYFDRIGATVNASYQGKPWLKIGSNMSVQSTKSRGGRSSRNALNPFQAIYDMFPFDPIKNPDGTWNTTRKTVNPLETMENNPSEESYINLMGSAFAIIDINKDFKLTSRIGSNYRLLETSYYVKQGSHLAIAINEDFKRERINRYSRSFANSVLEYNKTFNGIHEVSAKLGGEYQYDERIYKVLEGKDFPTPSLSTLENAAKPTKAESSIVEGAILSAFTNMKYIYDSKYVVDFSLRRDGSSRFGTDNKYGTFWATGLAWNASKEEFISNISQINNLKVRFSVGTSGNDRIGDYAYMDLIKFGKYDSKPAAVATQVGNPELKWETTTQYSTGIDFSLFNDRVSGSVDLYKKITNDMLFSSQLSRTTGFSSVMRNIGSMENKGIELVINTIPYEQEDFKWELGVSYFANRSEITKLYKGDDVETGISILREGEPLFAYYMNRYAGVHPASGEPLYYTKDGKITNKQDDEDRVVLDKTPFAKFAGNISTGLTYKGLRLDCNFYYKYGNYIYNLVAGAVEDPSNSQGNVSRKLFDAWQKPGDITTIAKPSESTQTYVTDQYLQDASYIRLRDLTLSYSLPERLVKKAKLTKLTFSATGHNLWIYCPNYTGPDPEVGSGGESSFGDYGTTYDYTYPAVRSFTFGVELTF